DIGPTYYGYCAPEDPIRGQKFRTAAYCVLDNDFAEFPAGATQSLNVTAAHEFFHAIQFNYDVAEDRWIMEATATWMEERYADDINDNRQYLPASQLSKPRIPLDTPGGLGQYGNWIFFEKIHERYGERAIRRIWHRLDASEGAADHYSIQGVRKYLKKQGMPFRRFYARFASGNLTPSLSYSEGATYPATPVARSFWMSTRYPASGLKEIRLRHLSSTSYAFTRGRSLTGKWRLQIDVDGPRRRTRPDAIARIYFVDGEVTRKRIKLNRWGKGSAAMRFGTRVTQVTLTLVNASTKYGCFQRGSYSCQGVPTYDNSKFSFDVSLLR
ncbi:MAG: MXAN_6640 family putative metalloprotease, partial [Nocardioides sp.]